MKTIEERAKEYAYFNMRDLEIDLDEAESFVENAYKDGAKSEHEELTRWNSLDEYPELEKRVLVRVQNEITGKIDYSLGRYYHYGWDAIGIYSHYKILDWREIHE